VYDSNISNARCPVSWPIPQHNAAGSARTSPRVWLIECLQCADAGQCPLAPAIGIDSLADHGLKYRRNHPVLIQDDRHDVVIARGGKLISGDKMRPESAVYGLLVDFGRFGKSLKWCDNRSNT